MASSTLFVDPSRGAMTHAPGIGPVRARLERLLAVLFLALITLPPATMVAGRDTAGEVGEHRALVPRPAIAPTWASVSSFGRRFQQYFEDHFAFRTQLVHWHALLKARALHVSPSTSVLWGRDGWLFYADDGATEDILSETPMTADELETWRRTLLDNRDWLRAHGVAYVFTLAPDKHEIYPEYLPAIHRLAHEPRIDQLAAYLRAHTDLTLVDLKTPLLDAKARDRVYHRTDTHWNDRGAYVGYRALIDAVAACIPGVEPARPLSEFTPVRRVTGGRDLADMLGLRDTLPEEDLRLDPRQARLARVVEPPHAPSRDEPWLVTSIPGSTRPRALVFRDSFMTGLIPFLSEHFGRVAYAWQHDLDPDMVLREKPAVVIHEIVGRHLVSLVPYDAVARKR